MAVRQQGLDKQTNTCFLQVYIGAKTQCLSKEIGVGVGGGVNSFLLLMSAHFHINSVIIATHM